MTPARALFILVAIFGASARADEPTLSAGAAAVEITPAPGIPMAGYYHFRAAEGVHDDLYAKALVLRRGDQAVALVALDLISTTRELVEQAREKVRAATGIPGDHVMISATHAHTGPNLPGRGVRDAFLGADTPAARLYAHALPGKIAQAVKLANDKSAPARLEVGHGRESSIAFNRRFHMADGSVGWNPGKGNREIVKPAGTIDPDVPVVHLATRDGRRTIATYVNYAVHLDNVGGAKISADVPGVLSRLVADYRGPDAVTLFTAGCCGDINHIDVHWPEVQQGYPNIARMGTILAAEVFRTFPKLEESAPGAIRVRSEMVALDLAEVTSEQVAKAREFAEAKVDTRTGRDSFMTTVDAFKVLDVADRAGKPLEVEVQVIAVGEDLAFVSLPGEVFVELGLALKQDSPFPNTIVAELANGSIGYIPSRRAYPQGNYEVVSARCAAGSGEKLVEAAVRMLKALHVDMCSTR